jgi:putative heme-binding domain-containing protein
VVTRYHEALALQGSFDRGRAIFQSQCSSCHRVAGIGADVGPDISDSRVKQPAQYLSDILDPNRAIDANFFGYTLLATDGRLLTGIITAETATAVTLRQPDGRDETLLREEIDQLRSTGQSLMPVGLERSIDLQQMADLINFLKNWRYETAAAPPRSAAP